MDEMIAGLLAFSHATRQPLNLVLLDMTPLVRAAVAEARVAHPNPQARVEIGDLPRAAADPSVIRHVWSNLIGNAFKYSAQRAEPLVRITGRVEGEEIIFKVEDNGAGFDMQYAGKLFGVFKRLHTSKEFQGTGVGLAVAYRIVTRHGGRIWAQAAPDAGACFQFSLPASVRTPLIRAAGDSANS
jgi:two-component system, sensor histidine kinase and response regulator